MRAEPFKRCAMVKRRGLCVPPQGVGRCGRLQGAAAVWRF